MRAFRSSACAFRRSCEAKIAVRRRSLQRADATSECHAAHTRGFRPRFVRRILPAVVIDLSHAFPSSARAPRRGCEMTLLAHSRPFHRGSFASRNARGSWPAFAAGHCALAASRSITTRPCRALRAMRRHRHRRTGTGADRPTPRAARVQLATTNLRAPENRGLAPRARAQCGCACCSSGRTCASSSRARLWLRAARVRLRRTLP